jgi:hypothetical protein
MPGVPFLEVGTGADRFEPIEDGEEIPLVMAPQTGTPGATGFHFDVSLRARSVDHECRVVVTIARDDGRVVSTVDRQIRLMASGEDLVFAGIRAVVTSCGDTANQDLELSGDLTDAAGATARGERRIRGPMFCPR